MGNNKKGHLDPETFEHLEEMHRALSEADGYNELMAKLRERPEIIETGILLSHFGLSKVIRELRDMQEVLDSMGPVVAKLALTQLMEGGGPKGKGNGSDEERPTAHSTGQYL